MNVISYGGGVQSTAMLVLANQGKLGLDVSAALFANVGDDSETPDTIRYVREIAQPWSAIPVVELHKVRRNGERETLLGRINRSERSIPFPVRMSNGAPGNRQCTGDFKIAVVAKWIKAQGATPANPATVCIGISTDEFQRASGRSPRRYEEMAYPLLDLGLNRSDCEAIIRDAGLPTPPKSACWFCPMMKPSMWAEMRRDNPERFAAAVELEAAVNVKRDRLGKDHVFFTRFARPLAEAVPVAQSGLFNPDGHLFGGDVDDSTCDSGYCFT